MNTYVMRLVHPSTQEPEGNALVDEGDNSLTDENGNALTEEG